MQNDFDRQQIAELLRSLSSTSKAISDVRECLSAIELDEYLKARDFGKKLVQLEKVLADSHKSIKRLDIKNLERVVAENAEDQRLSFESDIITELRGRSMDVSGHWPELLVNQALQLKINLNAAYATINGSKVRYFSVKRIAECVEEAWQQAEKSTDLSNFIDIVTKSYEQIATREDSDPNGYVDIRLIYDAVSSKRPKTYDTTAFGIECYRTMFATQNGPAIELSPAQSASGGIFIPSPGGGNYIAALRIRRGGR